MAQLVLLKDDVKSVTIVTIDLYPVLKTSDRHIKNLVDSIGSLSASRALDTFTYASSTLTFTFVDNGVIAITFSSIADAPPGAEYTISQSGAVATVLDPDYVLASTVLGFFIELYVANPLTSLSYTTP
jgi:hypothetical protein